MRLSSEKVEKFYNLWLPLVSYANNEGKLSPKLPMLSFGMNIKPADVLPTAEYIWDNIDVIDRYIDAGKDKLSDEDIDILCDWKQFVRSRFIVERHLKKGSIFIDAENGEVYQVSGLQSSWEETLSFTSLPVMIETTLLPFDGIIVTDGLLMASNICFGASYKRSFKEHYMLMKQNGKIHKSL